MPITFSLLFTHRMYAVALQKQMQTGHTYASVYYIRSDNSKRNVDNERAEWRVRLFMLFKRNVEWWMRALTGDWAHRESNSSSMSPVCTLHNNTLCWTILVLRVSPALHLRLSLCGRFGIGCRALVAPVTTFHFNCFRPAIFINSEIAPSFCIRVSWYDVDQNVRRLHVLNQLAIMVLDGRLPVVWLGLNCGHRISIQCSLILHCCWIDCAGPLNQMKWKKKNRE